LGERAGKYRAELRRLKQWGPYLNKRSGAALAPTSSPDAQRIMKQNLAKSRMAKACSMIRRAV
jgi:hypothetical protein